MLEDTIQICNPSTNREDSFEEVEGKSRPSFLFGWLNNDAETKKDD